MRIEYSAIVQNECVGPEKALRIAERQSKSEELGADDALVKANARPVHPGGILNLGRGLPTTD
jgi:hypothetical protein